MDYGYTKRNDGEVPPRRLVRLDLSSAQKEE
jgi:hypothetical protein